MTELQGRWQADLEAAITEARDQLTRLQVSRPLRRAAEATLSGAGRVDRDRALDLVLELTSELAALDQLMKELHEKGVAAEHAEATKQPFGEAWLSQLRRRLSKIDSTADWMARLIDAWSFAVAARRWETADNVARMGRNRPGAVLPVDTLIALGADLAAHRWEGAVRLIDLLLADACVPTITAVRLLVAKARLCLFRMWNPEAALVATEAATRWAARGPRWSRDLARAATVETLIELGNLDEAYRLADGVLDHSVGVPDLLVVAGTLRERAGDQPGAQDLYDAAVLRFGDRATAGWLFAPMTTSFLWRAALNAWPNDPERVLSLLDQGIELAGTNTKEGPDRQPWLYRAEVLEQLGRTREAAAAYHTAARRYEAAGLWSLEYYERAYRLDPDERRYGWSYAEALRVAATAGRSTPDVDALQHARAVMDGALAGHVLDPGHAWVLGTSAMIAWALGDQGALRLAERSLVLDPSYGRGYGFVSLLLRDKGYVGPARVAAQGGYRADRTDSFVAAQLAYAEVEAGAFAEAIQVLDDYLAYFDPDADVVVAKACVELWSGRADAALATLEMAPDRGAPTEAMLIAQCYAVLDQRDREREIYDQLVASGADRTSGLAGWVAYGLEHFDDAVELLATDDPRGDPAVMKMDCGQALIARGHDGDVETGRLLLLDGVGACTSVSQLLHLLHPEIFLLERRLLGREDSAAETAVRQVREAVGQRIESMRASGLEPGTTAHTLAQARTEAAADQPGRALELYLALAHHPDLPEIQLRLQHLAQDLLDQGDALLVTSGVPAARSSWAAVDQLPRDEVGLRGLLGQVDARLALADLATDKPLSPTALERLSRCRGTDLMSAAPRFARDLGSLRRVLGGLELATRSDRMPWAGQLSEFQRAVYRTLLDPGHARVADLPGARHIGAVEMRLGGGLAQEYDGGLLKAGIETLREELSAETGIQIPGVKVVLHRETKDRTARFSVYGDEVGDHGKVVAGAETLERLLAAFEEILRHNLYRWLSVDDLFLWCTGWQPGTGAREDGLLSLLPSTPWGKLQLARLIKMLLREGIPADDRPTILNAFSIWQADGGTDLRGVYEELRARLVRVPAGSDLVTLPLALQDRVAGAIGQGGGVWSMPRIEACRLVEDLKALVGADRDAPLVVTVQDPAVRSYVWRLLAAERPRVQVVVEGERS